MDKDSVQKKLLEIMQAQSHGKLQSLGYDDDLSRAGFDSLMLAEIIMCVEEEFDCVIRMDELVKLRTVNALTDYILRMKAS